MRFRVSWLSPNSESTAQKSKASQLSLSDKIVRQALLVSEANIIWRYSLAVLAVVAAAVLRLAFDSVLGLRVPYWSFTVAVIVASWVGGRGPSLAATALSALAVVWLFIPPTHSFAIADPASAWGLGLFVITVAPIGLMIVSLREALLAERASEARFEFVLNAAQLGAWDLDLVSHRVWSAPQHNAIFGYPAAAQEGTYETYLAHVLPEDREEVERRFQLAVSTGSDFESEYRICRVDGAVRWIWAGGRIQSYENGRPVHVSGLTRDITQRKMAEESVRESEARLQFVLDAANLGAWERDMVRHTVVWRAGHYDALFGYHVPLTEWSWETFLDHVVPEDRGELDRKFREFAASGTDHRWQHEFRIRRADGAVRWIGTVGRARREEDGRAGRIFGVNKDITERKVAEEHLRYAQKMESIGTLAGGIAHDFNNLLMVIMGNADCALTEHPDSKHIQQILTGSQRAAYLTRQLLAYAGKGLYLARKTFNLGDLVSRSMPLLSASVPRKVSVKFNQPADELLIYADPTQIEQIVVNLVINAGEAIPPDSDGWIEASLSLCDVTLDMIPDHWKRWDVKPGRFVCLDVVDNGSGMDESTLAQVFDPFFSTKFTGRGLGLAAVQGIVRSCGGFIDVQSSPGAGAAFRVFLPAAGDTASMDLPIGTRPGVSWSQDRAQPYPGS